NDRLLLPLPFFHVYPLNMGTLGPLRMGLTLILPRSITGPEIMRAINEGKCTVVLGVPRLLRSLYTAVESKFHAHKVVAPVFDAAMALSGWVRSLSPIKLGKLFFHPVHRKFSPTLRLFCCGGAPLDAKLCRKLMALGWDVAVGYGLTETAPLLSMRMPENHDVEGVGNPIPNVQIRVQKEEPGKDDATTRDAREGEVQAKGPNIFHGYLHLEDKTEESFTPDGWFRTGDLGYLQFGNLHITGRASTTLVLEGGKKIQPDDLEEKFAHEKTVREIAVLQYEHKLVALVVPNLRAAAGGNAKDAVSAAINTVNRGLPSYERIADFASTREPLPRTNLGKVKRHELEERYKKAKAGKEGRKKTAQSIEEMPADDRGLMQEPIAQELWAWLQERFPNAGLNMDQSPQLDLNVDSLEWMNLTLAMREKTGIELSEEAIARIDTVRDLIKEVAEAARDGQKVEGSPFTQPEKFIDAKQKRWLKPLNPVEKVLATGFYYSNRFVARLLFQVEPVGLENIPRGQCVFTPNHASYLDAFCLCAVLPYNRLKRTQIAGWAGIAFHNPFNSFWSRLVMV
ncbi:MAG: AMP-binding protein, partial [Terriglobales bacterium]